MANPEPLFGLYQRVRLLTGQTIEIGDKIYPDPPANLPPDAKWPEPSTPVVAMVVAIFFSPETRNTVRTREVDEAGKVLAETEDTRVSPAEYQVWIKPTDIGSKADPATKRPLFEGARCEHVPVSSVVAADEMWPSVDVAHNEIAIRVTEITEESMDLVERQRGWAEDRQARVEEARRQAAMVPPLAPVP